MDDRKLYEKLYRFAQQQASENGQELVLPENAFVSAALQHPCCLDMSTISGLDAKDYICTAFWSIFNRVPTETDMVFWLGKEKKLEREVFQKKICKRLSRRIEAKMKNVGFTENYFPELAAIPCSGGRFAPESRMGKFYYYFYLPLFHRIFTLLYRVYGKTLRPVRQWFRRRKFN